TDPRVAAVLRSVLDDAGALDADHAESTVALPAPGRARIIVADARAVAIAPMLATAGEWTCVSNLPYNAAVTVVLRLLDEVEHVRRMLVMVQREAGERLAARVGDAQYGAVSVHVGYHAEASVIGVVPAAVFLPVPKVESALVRLVRRVEPAVS